MRAGVIYFPCPYDENWIDFERLWNLEFCDRVRKLGFEHRLGSIVLLSPKSGRYMQGTVSLDDFVHPAEATYVVGPNCRDLMPEDLDEVCGQPDHFVYIPLVPELLASHAMTITLWHRRTQFGGT